MIRSANRAFRDYLRFQGEENFEQAAEVLSKLSKTLNRLLERQDAENGGKIP
jgi:hypothetical protein